MRPSEHALASGIPSAIGFGVLAGWQVGLNVLLNFVVLAFAMRNLGPRAGMGD
jgi:hypothetical protein